MNVDRRRSIDPQVLERELCLEDPKRRRFDRISKDRDSCLLYN